MLKYPLIRMPNYLLHIVTGCLLGYGLWDQEDFGKFVLQICVQKVHQLCKSGASNKESHILEFMTFDHKLWTWQKMAWAAANMFSLRRLQMRVYSEVKNNLGVRVIVVFSAGSSSVHCYTCLFLPLRGSWFCNHVLKMNAPPTPLLLSPQIRTLQTWESPHLCPVGILPLSLFLPLFLPFSFSLTCFHIHYFYLNKAYLFCRSSSYMYYSCCLKFVCTCVVFVCACVCSNRTHAYMCACVCLCICVCFSLSVWHGWPRRYRWVPSDHQRREGWRRRGRRL